MPRVDWLILVPTQRELDGLDPALICRSTGLHSIDDITLMSATRAVAEPIEPRAGIDSGRDRSARFELCGFGPIAAAAFSTRLISKWQPKQVMLLGIAGTFGNAVEIGTALVFSRVKCWGVGAGTGSNFTSCEAMGYSQSSPGVASNAANNGECIQLVHAGTDDCLLLTVCSASASDSDRVSRLQSNPHARAEDMEGFGAALACRQFGRTLAVVRGISNLVGDRNLANWKVDEALLAARTLAIAILLRQ